MKSHVTWCLFQNPTIIAATAAMAATATPAIVPWDQPLFESGEGVGEENGILPGEDVDEEGDRSPEDGDSDDGDNDGSAAETSG